MTARRFLASQAGASTGRAYYTQPQRPTTTAIPDDPGTIERIAAQTAMCDEPEAPSHHWINTQTELAAKYNRLRHLHEVETARGTRQALTIENRMRDAHRRAKHRHIDITGELHVLAQMLDRGNQTTATTRLEQLEANLDGVTANT